MRWVVNCAKFQTRKTDAVKACGLSLHTPCPAQPERDKRFRIDPGHRLGNPTQSDSLCRIAAPDSSSNLGRASARHKFLLSEMEKWRSGKSPHEGDSQIAPRGHRPGERTLSCIWCRL